MADVTRWEMRYPISVHGENPWGPLPSPDGGWVTAADHLAALERVRVETLREIKTAVMHLPVVGRLAGTDSTLAAVHVLGAIDRLINAATTGDTDD